MLHKFFFLSELNTALKSQPLRWSWLPIRPRARACSLLRDGCGHHTFGGTAGALDLAGWPTLSINTSRARGAFRQRAVRASISVPAGRRRRRVPLTLTFLAGVLVASKRTHSFGCRRCRSRCDRPTPTSPFRGAFADAVPPCVNAVRTANSAHRMDVYVRLVRWQ